MLTLAVARSETIAHKLAVSLQSQRVSSGPSYGQDVLKRTAFRCSFSNDSTLSTMLDAGWAGAACKKNFGGALDHCNRSKRAAPLAPAAATALIELLRLSLTIRALRKHT